MSTPSTFTAYVTKYALTQGKGIIECLVSSQRTYEGHVHTDQISGFSEGFGPKEWSRTREEAVALAEEMRKAEIAKLRQKILRLEALRF